MNMSKWIPTVITKQFHKIVMKRLRISNASDEDWLFYLGGMEIVVDEESELNTWHSLSFREYSMDVYKKDGCELF
jgi:hypothetical protein